MQSESGRKNETESKEEKKANAKFNMALGMQINHVTNDI